MANGTPVGGSKKLDKEFRKMAEAHARFLAEEVWVPTYVIGFTHGARHALKKLEKGRRRNGMSRLRVKKIRKPS